MQEPKIPKNETPAAYVIRLFGGTRKTARLLRMNPSSVSQWKKARKNCKKKGQRMGLIPAEHHRNILKIAGRRGLDITPHHIIYGHTQGEQT